MTETTCETAEIVVLQDCWPRPVQTSLATASALERASQRWRAVGPGSNWTQSSSWSFLGAFFEIQKGSKKGPKNQDFKWLCWNKLFAWCYLCFKSLHCTYFICSRFESMDLLRKQDHGSAFNTIILIITTKIVICGVIHVCAIPGIGCWKTTMALDGISELDESFAWQHRSQEMVALPTLLQSNLSWEILKCLINLLMIFTAINLHLICVFPSHGWWHWRVVRSQFEVPRQMKRTSSADGSCRA